MNNYELHEHKRSDTVKWIIAFTLIAVLLVGMFAVLFVNFGDKAPETTEPEQETTTTTATNFVASPMAGQLMRLSALSAPATASSSEVLTINATLTADNSLYNENITWQTYFDDADSSWASGKSVEDYVNVTVSEDTHSVTVECLAPFGEPIVIKAISDDNVACSATCQLDYVKRINKITNFYINTDSTNGTNYKNYMRFGITNSVTAFVEYGVGTISPEIAINSIDFALSTDFQNVIKNNITAGAMTARSSINAIVHGDAKTGTYITGNFDVEISNLYNGGGDNRALNNVVYNNAYNAATGSGAPYMGGKPTIEITVSYGGKTYQVFEYTHTSSIPFERGSLVLNTSVTNLTLDETNYAF